MVYEKSVYKYLNSYAEPIAYSAKTCSINYSLYTHALVVPIYDEYENCINLLNNITLLQLNGKLLVTLIINDNELSSYKIKQENKRIYNFLASHNQIIQQDNFLLLNFTNDIDIAVFYLCGNNHIQAKHGVGLARKIGCDFILHMCQNQTSKIKWIHSTDADVILPIDYFKQIPEATTKALSAYTYAFAHYVPNNNDILLAAIKLYENSLETYVKGLILANSPYAYHTIGSLLAISPLCYAQVRGFPKLNAAEDFYLLNKLAKVAPIKTLQGEKIKLQARVSDRVPFGTGPALNKILQQDKAFISSLNYSAEAFKKLRIVIQFINQLSIENSMLDLSNSHPDIHHVLEVAGFYYALDKIKNNTKNNLKLSSHMHSWFDGFKTLKFIKHFKIL